MKKSYLLIFLSLLIGGSLYSQQCLPDGIIFSTQSQIDSFQVNYPNCTEIGGTVRIQGPNIKNLLGLNVITTIERSLVINGCDSLTTLSGLENLSSINEVLSLLDNERIKNLEGLNNVDSIGVWLDIHFNDSLENISALSNVLSIGNYLEITNNKMLVSIDGLENIQNSSLSYLEITNNASLVDCDAEVICNYLSNPPGKVVIFNNSTGCNSPPEIAENCGFTMPCLPFGHYYFFSQEDIDGFQQDYPGCDDLKGGVGIGSDDILNLQGLENLSSIEGNFAITNCTHLKNLAGLESLNSVGGDFWLKNNESLVNIEGSDNLNTIKGDFYLWSNDSLINLLGLENLNLVEGALYFWYNDTLSSLTGIENINPLKLNKISIHDNPYLTECDVLSVCGFIYNDPENCFIEVNDTGCDSNQEVKEACESVGEKEKNYNLGISIYPNPVNNLLNIKCHNSVNILDINIYNQFGQRELTRLNNFTKIDVSSLNSGLYIIEIVTRESKLIEKLIVK